MKKSALALSLFLSIAGAAGAQSSLVSQIAGDKAATEKLYFSLKLGMSCGTLKGTEDTERLGGPNVGLFATIRLSDKLSLVPEVDPVSRKGVTSIPFLTTGDPALDVFFLDEPKTALIVHYVDIPVQLKYRLGGRLAFGAGSFVGLRTTATERYKGTVIDDDDLVFRRDVTPEFAALDYGLVFEASVVVTKPRRGEGLVAHVRYQAGMADIVRSTASAAVRTSVIQFFLSFPFIHTDRP